MVNEGVEVGAGTEYERQRKQKKLLDTAVLFINVDGANKGIKFLLDQMPQDNPEQFVC